MSSESFDIPAFTPEPFVWNQTAAILDTLRAATPDTKSTPTTSITPEEAQSLVQWVVAGAADRLKKIFPKMQEDWGEYALGKCVFASAAARDLLRDIPKDYIHHFNMHRAGSTPHDVIILHLPIKSAKSDQAEWKSYVIDPTLVQFFHDHNIGKRMTETAEGRAFATELISHGYAELSEATAKLYTEAFVPSILLRNSLKNAGGSYLKLLTSPEFAKVEYSDDPRKIFKNIPPRDQSGEGRWA
ncbi:MAG: hypothetical protein SFT92_05445 [Rickettsiales bacterium]|nr:hypothetical protein [Rickettsiales bacterium]